LQQGVPGDSSSSDQSSVVGGAKADSKEKTSLLSFRAELQLHGLMKAYLAGLSNTSAPSSTGPLAKNKEQQGKYEGVAANCKVYAVRSHASFPQLIILGTSAGIVVVTLRSTAPIGAMSSCALHPKWGPIRFVVVDDGVHRLSLMPPTAGIHIATTTSTTAHLKPLHPISNSASSSSSPFGLGESSSKTTNNNSREQHVDTTTTTGRLALFASPSGNFLACLWTSSRHIIIYHSSSGIEVDRGPCMLFGWIGMDDSYLMKTPPELLTQKTAPKRSSMKDLFVSKEGHSGSAARGEVLRVSEVIAKRCFAESSSDGRTVVRTIHLPLAKTTAPAVAKSSSFQSSIEAQHFTADSVMNIFGGSLVNVVTPYSNSNSNAGQVVQSIGTESTSAVPPHHRAISRFYALVTNSWIRARIKIEMATAISRDLERQQARRGGQGRRGSSVVTTATKAAVTTPMGDEQSDIHGDDSELQFMAIGPSMRCPEMIRCDSYLVSSVVCLDHYSVSRY